MKQGKQLSFLIFATFIAVNSLPAQSLAFKLWLKVNEGGNIQDSLIFGLDPRATHAMDPLLGEFEGPPGAPPDGGAAWWIDPRGEDYEPSNIANLWPRDIRHLIGDVFQIDTFEVEFIPYYRSQATFYWPDRSVWIPTWSHVIIDSMILHDGKTDGSIYNVDMSYVDSLKMVDNSAHTILLYVYSSSVDGVKGKNTGIPASFSLHQNYPNPFNPVTMIRFELPTQSMVNLELYNLLGERIRTLLFGEQNAGVHEINFDGSNVPSGVYLYRLQTRDVTLTRKLTILR